MAGSSLSLKEVEKLGYYDFMSYLGVPFFHQGGLKSSLVLAGLCHIEKGKKVLVVGCGAGLSACFLAKRLGCNVVGVDIAEISIKKAKERAKRELIEDKAEFRIGDATDLPFEANTFDAVITEFVSIFLDKIKAIKEFVRVLKPGGYVGINELSKSQGIPSDIADEILRAEQLFQEITGLEFRLYTQNDWNKWLEEAGLKNVQIDGYNKHIKHISMRKLPEYNDHISLDELPEYSDHISIKELPMIVNVFRNLKEILSLKHNRRQFKYLILSKTIRNRLKKVRAAKAILFREKTTARYINCTIGVGQKEQIEKWAMRRDKIWKSGEIALPFPKEIRTAVP